MPARKSRELRSRFTGSRSKVQFAELFVGGLAAYTLTGVAFSVAFMLFGIHRVYPVAEHSPIGFRLIVMPGVVALWPLFLGRWLRVRRGRS
jgi:hypothetical protein